MTEFVHSSAVARESQVSRQGEFTMINFGRLKLQGKRFGTNYIVAPAILLCGSIALAQNTTPVLEEIIVTASKRGEQDLQTVPVTITAFSSESLQHRGLNNIEDISQFTAGMEVQKQAPGRTQVIIRGVTLGAVSSIEPQNRSTTGIYLNDVAFDQNGQNPDPDLFDLERVEVLKGPQGSLFGSSAMAGAVRYITKRPELNRASGRISGDYSNTEDGGDNYAIRGVVNIPLVNDKLAARVMAYHVDNDGWIDNIVTGNTNINTDKSSGARLSLLWQPTESFDAHWMLQYQDMAVGHGPSANSGDSPVYGPGPTSLSDYQTQAFAEASWDDEFLLSTLELNWDFDWGTLTSVTGWVDREFQRSIPSTMYELGVNFFATEFDNPAFVDPWFSDKITQELRVATGFGDKVSLTAGAYYSDGEVQYGTYASADGWDDFVLNAFAIPADFLGCAPEFPDHAFCGFQNNKERQIALFGEVDFSLSERVTLTAGGRWFDYEQKFFEPYGGFFNGGPTEKRQTINEDGFNPKLALSIQASEQLLLFASAAKGFRLGGVDDPLPDLCDADLAAIGLTNYTGSYDSDSLWTYEAGAKSTLNEGRVVLNGSVFFTEWDDIQTTNFLDCGFKITQNASKQEIVGLEVATSFALTEGLQLQLNGSYTDSELTADAPAAGGTKGDRAPYVPRFTFNGAIDYQRDLSSTIQGFVLVSASYKDEYYTSYDRSIRIPSQFVGNVRVGGRTERVTATVYINNFTNEDIIHNASAAVGGQLGWQLGRPRTIGLQLMLDF